MLSSKNRQGVDEFLEIKTFKECCNHGISSIEVFTDILHTLYYFTRGRWKEMPIKYNKSYYYDVFMDRTQEIPVEFLYFMGVYYDIDAEKIIKTTAAPVTPFSNKLMQGMKDWQQKKKQLHLDTKDILNITKKQPIPSDYLDMIFKIQDRLLEEEWGKSLIAVQLFSYGFIEGKRAERKRKGGSYHA